MCISMNVKTDKGLWLERNVKCKEKNLKLEVSVFL